MQRSLATGTAVLLISAAILANFFTHVESLKTNSNYQYQGCFPEAPYAQVAPLKDKVDNSSKMTADVCAEQCALNDYAYFGLQRGSECWCGNWIKAPKLLPSFCKTICTGSSAETCGGKGYVQIYKGVRTASLMIPAPMVGCFVDDGSNNILVTQAATDVSMNQRFCARICNKQYTASFFGLLNGTKCYCGNEIVKEDYLTNKRYCNLNCPGNRKEKCGGEIGMLAFEIFFSE
ncbi:hypothetical protein BOX15_Mlig003972g1 [Macrostomum lignano]|uniref:WSC domain-containing protein n=1 Tax=Macrostomum lignano TaxID=282301 RepID=A0A267GK10_9PLAT|nr:hypothetical protein BOX15_Mlig003972g1 [Macrostomum lignano]